MLFEKSPGKVCRHRGEGQGREGRVCDKAGTTEIWFPWQLYCITKPSVLRDQKKAPDSAICMLAKFKSNMLPYWPQVV